MEELQEVRNEVLHLKNMGVLNKKEEAKLLNKLNAIEKVINYTRCCKSDSELLKIPKTTKKQRVQLNEGYNKK